MHRAARAVCSCFDENDVVDRLAMLENVTGGALRWSETAGLKQVVRSMDISEDVALSYLPIDYVQFADRGAV